MSGLALSIEQLQPSPLNYSASSPVTPSLFGETAAISKVFLVEPTGMSVLAFAIARKPQARNPSGPLEGGGGNRGTPPVVSAMSLTGEAWRCPQASPRGRLPGIAKLLSQVKWGVHEILLGSSRTLFVLSCKFTRLPLTVHSGSVLQSLFGPGEERLSGRFEVNTAFENDAVKWRKSCKGPPWTHT